MNAWRCVFARRNSRRFSPPFSHLRDYGRACSIELHAREKPMPRGSKEAYTDKQKRKAEHIEEGYEKRGVSHGEAERRAWATVNKQEGGGKKSGSGRKH
jgi:hypothetical protein